MLNTDLLHEWPNLVRTAYRFVVFRLKVFSFIAIPISFFDQDSEKDYRKPRSLFEFPQHKQQYVTTTNERVINCCHMLSASNGFILSRVWENKGCRCSLTLSLSQHLFEKKLPKLTPRLITFATELFKNAIKVRITQRQDKIF